MPTSGKRPLASLKEADLKGKKVFVRVDLNVPLDDNLQVTDDTRIRSVDTTVKYLIKNGAKTILASHLVILRLYSSCLSACIDSSQHAARLSTQSHCPCLLIAGQAKEGTRGQVQFESRCPTAF